jgi:two-component system, NtrC family, sensor kinase
MFKVKYFSRVRIGTNKTVRKKKHALTMPAFAAGLAHELGNPLDAVLRYVNLALDQGGEDPLLREYLLKAKKGVFRTLRVMNELMVYSRQSQDSPAKIIEIHELLNRSLRELSSDENFKNISIQRIFCEEPLYIEDRGLLMALQNLYKNAAQAMDHRGTLTVATWRQNGSVGVSVQDTGHGVPENIMNRIFEPFFSTKKRSDGTGIGLALSQEIVERSGGELRCENTSEPISGARFISILPRKSLSLL